MKNPFRPTAGATPPDLVDRGGVLDEFAYGLTIGSGAPGLLTIFTGARGIGKTVMLGAAEDLALNSGWAVVSETATGGFVGRIGESMRRLTNELGEGPTGRRVTAVSVAGISVTTQLAPEEQVDWRARGVALLQLLTQRGAGLIITVDEIHAADRAELSQLAADVQHFIREGLPIGLIFAGLPAAVSDLLNEGVATFLRRADRIDLHAASITEVERSFTETFASAGMTLNPELAKDAAEATGGYPFLIQLIGYYLWQEAEKAPGGVDADAVGRAVLAGRRRNERVVIEAALSTTSARDQDFLRAMAKDPGASSATDIGRRTGMRPNAVGNYRTRLMDAGLIEPAGYGLVDFAIPGLREYMTSHPSRN
ncbi:ATP-binding protein [Arthrobacter sp. FW305-BF8]|uniref:ATP-binding protein n=1 Tax=Arthrobacter sp. FW305-BF8 TaxID=2879617 RepID=UPI001F328011|nr:ATP-binding protein [Arthrobacter sp. FW305-BF8]UKA53435.1 ATP-binding protein [Arthrobacter sp. FW305-BF8]